MNLNNIQINKKLNPSKGKLYKLCFPLLGWRTGQWTFNSKVLLEEDGDEDFNKYKIKWLNNESIFIYLETYESVKYKFPYWKILIEDQISFLGLSTIPPEEITEVINEIIS